jgi:hypothetical protein
MYGWIDNGPGTRQEPMRDEYECEEQERVDKHSTACHKRAQGASFQTYVLSS